MKKLFYMFFLSLLMLNNSFAEENKDYVMNDSLNQFYFDLMVLHAGIKNLYAAQTTPRLGESSDYSGINNSKLINAQVMPVSFRSKNNTLYKEVIVYPSKLFSDSSKKDAFEIRITKTDLNTCKFLMSKMNSSFVKYSLNNEVVFNIYEKKDETEKAINNCRKENIVSLYSY